MSRIIYRLHVYSAASVTVATHFCTVWRWMVTEVIEGGDVPNVPAGGQSDCCFASFEEALEDAREWVRERKEGGQ